MENYISLKNITKTLVTCFLLVVFSNAKAQESAILKSFINKNELAVRSVQKYSINLTGEAVNDNVKDLLKLQIASVKLYNSDPSKSADIAYTVRKKCGDFLKINSKGSLEYLNLSDKEKAFFSSPKTIEKADSDLDPAELQKINSLNVKDPHQFDDLTIKIN
jgi:hypothetical protein